MESVAWSIAVLIAIVVVLVAFCVMCGIAAEEKGRSLWWAVMGLFNIFGLIVVLLLDRTVASAAERKMAIERNYSVLRSPGRPGASPRLRGEAPTTSRPSAYGARRSENPVRAWLSKGSGGSDANPVNETTHQERSEPGSQGEESQDS